MTNYDGCEQSVAIGVREGKQKKKEIKRENFYNYLNKHLKQKMSQKIILMV